jgi:hypothetical protein
MTTIFRLNVVALKMPRDIGECHGISIDVEGLDGTAIVAIVFGLLQLALEEL